MPMADVARHCHAIVLAAGAAERFDGAKLLAPLRGEALISLAVRAALATRVESVTVVVGARAGEVEQCLAPLAGPRLSIVLCENWNEGLSASLKCGLASLPKRASAALIFLGDMPGVNPALADEVLEVVIGGASAALPDVAGIPGHPVAISSTLFARLENLVGDRGARSVLEGAAGVVRIETSDPGCIQDVDTRSDLENLRRVKAPAVATLPTSIEARR